MHGVSPAGTGLFCVRGADHGMEGEGMTTDAKTVRVPAKAKAKVVPVPVCFTPDGLRALDAGVKRRGMVSRSALVRHAVSEYLRQQTAP